LSKPKGLHIPKTKRQLQMEELRQTLETLKTKPDKTQADIEEIKVKQNDLIILQNDIIIERLK